MEKENLEQFREQLLQMREQLAGGVSQHTQEGFSLGNDGTQDVGDDAANSYARQLLLGLSERERSVLRQIEGALERIADGSFNECEECGDEIGEPRLRAVPYASLCVDCKSNLERNR